MNNGVWTHVFEHGNTCIVFPSHFRVLQSSVPLQASHISISFIWQPGAQQSESQQFSIHRVRQLLNIARQHCKTWIQNIAWIEWYSATISYVARSLLCRFRPLRSNRNGFVMTMPTRWILPARSSSVPTATTLNKRSDGHEHAHDHRYKGKNGRHHRKAVAVDERSAGHGTDGDTHRVHCL